MFHQIPRWAWTVLFVGAIGCRGGDEGRDKPNIHETPEVVFDACKNAMNEGDWTTAFECMTDETQDWLCGGALRVCDLQAYDGGEKQKALKSLMAKHGIKRVEDGVSSVSAKGRLYGELKTWWTRFAAEEDADRFPTLDDLFRVIELTNIVVNGDVATADVFMKGKKQADALHFRRVSDKWLVALPETHAAGIKRRRNRKR